MRGAVNLPRPEVSPEPVRHQREAVGVQVEQRAGSLQALGAVDDELRAAGGPVADALGPAAGVRPACGSALGDALEHQQLRAVDVAEDRDAGGDAPGGLVERGQVVQIEHVGLGASCGGELARPGVDLALEGGVVERGEDRVLGVAAILVGSVHRRRSRTALEAEGVVACDRLGEVHRAEVGGREELLGRAEARVVRARAGQQRHVESLPIELSRDRLTRVRRTTAGIEVEPHQQLVRIRAHSQARVAAHPQTQTSAAALSARRSAARWEPGGPRGSRRRAARGGC